MRARLARRRVLAPQGRRGRAAIEVWERWMSAKALFLETAGSFPVAARLAALRELAEAR